MFAIFISLVIKYINVNTQVKGRPKNKRIAIQKVCQKLRKKREWFNQLKIQGQLLRQTIIIQRKIVFWKSPTINYLIISQNLLHKKAQPDCDYKNKISF